MSENIYLFKFNKLLFKVQVENKTKIYIWIVNKNVITFYSRFTILIKTSKNEIIGKFKVSEDLGIFNSNHRLKKFKICIT